MFVGGEFYYEPEWIRDTPVLSTENMVFLNGGAACLTVIGDFLLDHGIHRVLLPSYLCPSIVTVFERCGLAWEFYQVNEDLSIDLADVSQKLDGFRAVYFINYFGFSHAPETQAFFRQLQQQGILVIEDNAQRGFSDCPLGDFTLNSLRKLAAYDGGYLSTQFDVTPYLSRYQGLPNHRLPLIRAYRERLYPYLHDHAGSYAELASLFQQATRIYETEPVVLGDAGERGQIERFDWDAVRLVRRENFQYLMNWVSSIPEITPIYRALQPDTMPFGLPVYFPAALRDPVYEALGKAGISLVIHWDELRADPRTNQNRRAVDMAGRMLTLAIDQRVSHKQMDYLAMNLIRAIRG